MDKSTVKIHHLPLLLHLPLISLLHLLLQLEDIGRQPEAGVGSLVGLHPAWGEEEEEQEEVGVSRRRGRRWWSPE